MLKYYTRKQLAARIVIIGIIVAVIIGAVKLVRQRHELDSDTGDMLMLESYAYQYTGKPIHPKITVYSGNGPLDSKNYKVSYSKNTNTGIAAVTVSGTGLKYGGKLTAHFIIMQRSPDRLDKMLYSYALSDSGVNYTLQYRGIANLIIWLAEDRTPQEIKVRVQNFRKSISDKRFVKFYSQWNTFGANITYTDKYTPASLSNVPQKDVKAAETAIQNKNFKKNWKTLQKFMPDTILVKKASDADKYIYKAAQ